MGVNRGGEGDGTPEHPLEHMATVMRLYSRHQFARDCFQWTKCVVKYLHDSATSGSPLEPQLIVFLTEVMTLNSVF